MPPPTVVTDTDVTSAWGNTVRANIITLDAHVVNLAAEAAAAASAIAGKASLGADNVWTGAQFINSTGLTGGYPGLDKQGFYINSYTGWMRINNHGGDTSTSGITITLSGAGDFVGKRFLVFGEYTTEVGSVTLAGPGSVSYNSTSDPRLKTPKPAARGGDSDGIGDAAERVQQLGAQAWVGQWVDTHNGEAVGGDWDFLSSHDIQDVAPYAVIGERDAVAGPPQNEGEPEEGSPIYQQVNYPALVPLLTAALSQALDRIAELTTRIEALETA